MSRLTLILALLGFLLGGTGLWISSSASAANAAERRRIEAECAELKQSLLQVSGQIADLRSDLVALGNRASSAAVRSAVVPDDEVAQRAADPGLTAAVPVLEGPSSDSIDLAQRYRTLTEDAKKDALEDLAGRARLGDEEALRLVLESLNDASPEVREKAAKMLGDLADPALIGHLKDAASDPDAEVRAAVAESLEKLPANDAGPILVGMLRDRDPEVVGEAIKALSKLDYPQARPYIVDQLSSDDLDLATRAAAALRGMGDEGAALATIDRIMKDYARGDDEQRIRDVEWLRRVGGASAIARLRTIMETDASLVVRAEAREAIAKLGS